MMPQGDQFEDQYTSATADLSAGGVALATAAQRAVSSGAGDGGPTPTASQTAGEAWSSSTIAHEGASVELAPGPRGVSKAAPMSRLIGPAAAVLLVIVGALVGAWLYARWQQRREQPLSRLRRSLLR
jgi:hypothetical protein